MPTCVITYSLAIRPAHRLTSLNQPAAWGEPLLPRVARPADPLLPTPWSLVTPEWQGFLFLSLFLKKGWGGGSIERGRGGGQILASSFPEGPNSTHFRL